MFRNTLSKLVEQLAERPADEVQARGYSSSRHPAPYATGRRNDGGSSMEYNTFGEDRGRVGNTFGEDRGRLGNTFAEDRGRLGNTFGKDRGKLSNAYGEDRGRVGNTFGEHRGRLGNTFGEDRGRLGNTFGEDRGRLGNTFGEDRGKLGNTFGEDRGRVGNPFGEHRGKLGNTLGEDRGRLGNTFGEHRGRLGNTFGEHRGRLAGGTGFENEERYRLIDSREQGRGRGGLEVNWDNVLLGSEKDGGEQNKRGTSRPSGKEMYEDNSGLDRYQRRSRNTERNNEANEIPGNWDLVNQRDRFSSNRGESTFAEGRNRFDDNTERVDPPSRIMNFEDNWERSSSSSGRPGSTQREEVISSGRPGSTRREEVISSGRPGSVRSEEGFSSGRPRSTQNEERFASGRLGSARNEGGFSLPVDIGGLGGKPTRENNLNERMKHGRNWPSRSRSNESTEFDPTKERSTYLREDSTFGENWDRANRPSDRNLEGSSGRGNRLSGDRNLEGSLGRGSELSGNRNSEGSSGRGNRLSGDRNLEGSSGRGNRLSGDRNFEGSLGRGSDLSGNINSEGSSGRGNKMNEDRNSEGSLGRGNNSSENRSAEGSSSRGNQSSERMPSTENQGEVNQPISNEMIFAQNLLQMMKTVGQAIQQNQMGLSQSGNMNNFNVGRGQNQLGSSQFSNMNNFNVGRGGINNRAGMGFQPIDTLPLTSESLGRVGFIHPDERMRMRSEDDKANVPHSREWMNRLLGPKERLNLCLGSGEIGKFVEKEKERIKPVVELAPLSSAGNNWVKYAHNIAITYPARTLDQFQSLSRRRAPTRIVENENRAKLPQSNEPDQNNTDSKDDAGQKLSTGATDSSQGTPVITQTKEKKELSAKESTTLCKGEKSNGKSAVPTGENSKAEEVGVEGEQEDSEDDEDYDEEEEEEDPYRDFVILDRKYDKGAFPFYLTLKDSASFCNFEVEFILNKTCETDKMELSASIKGLPDKFPPGIGNDKGQAKEKGAEIALNILAKRCPKVKYIANERVVLLSEIKSSMEAASKLDPSEFLDLEELGKEEVIPEEVPLFQEEPQLQKKFDLNKFNQLFHSAGETQSKVVTNSDNDFWSSAGNNNLLGSLVSQNSSSTQASQMSSGAAHDSQMSSSAAQNSQKSSSAPEESPLVSSVAGKMLKMMGWAGGGLGKDGSGITEPIQAAKRAGRYGIGHLKRKQIETQSNVKEDNKKIKRELRMKNKEIQNFAVEQKRAQHMQKQLAQISEIQAIFKRPAEGEGTTDQETTVEKSTDEPCSTDEPSAPLPSVEQVPTKKKKKKKKKKNKGLGSQVPEVAPQPTGPVRPLTKAEEDRKKHLIEIANIEKKFKAIPNRNITIALEIAINKQPTEHYHPNCRFRSRFRRRHIFQKLDPQASLKKLTDDKFERGVQLLIKNFMQKPHLHELMFSKELSNYQRLIIHEIAQLYKLSSVSFGEKKARHIVLFREHEVEDFLKNLQDLAAKRKKTSYQITMPPPKEKSKSN